jgi:tight adherence protein B
MILFGAFALILTITFGVVALVMNSNKQQRALEKRLESIKVHNADAGARSTEIGDLLKADPSSNQGWFAALLKRFPISKMLEDRISQADSKMSVVALLLLSVCTAVAGYLLISLFVPIMLVQVAVGVACGGIPFGFISFKRSRRIAAFTRELPDAIDMMGRSLRAGHSMAASISIVGEQSPEPLGSEFREAFRQQNFGLPLRDALWQILEHVPSQDLRVLITGILVQKETGGNLAEILDRTAFVIRERLRIQGEIKTHTAQGRMTGWILCALPIVMLLVINLVNPGYSKVLTDTPIGHKLIYLGLGLLATGSFIIRQIINGIEV